MAPRDGGGDCAEIEALRSAASRGAVARESPPRRDLQLIARVMPVEELE